MSNGNAPAGPCIENLSADVIAQRVAYGGSNIGFIDHLGMTKREAFAMAAMQGAISTVDNGHVSYDILASDAVEMANALLKALEEEE